MLSVACSQLSYSAADLIRAAEQSRPITPLGAEPSRRSCPTREYRRAMPRFTETAARYLQLDKRG